MKVIMFNAPSGAGKDTVAAFFEAQLRYNDIDYKRRAIADLPKERLAYRIGIPAKSLFSRDLKDEPLQSGETPRKLLNEFSEMQKEVMGQDIWVRLMDEALDYPRRPRLLIVTDVGFDVEYEYLMDRYECQMVNITRMGHSHRNDYRKAIKSDPRITTTIVNDGDLEQLRVVSQYLCQQLVRELY